MYSTRVPDYVPRSSFTPPKRSRTGRIALVATLAGFGIAALAVTNIAPSELRRIATAAETQAAPAGNEDYFPARFTIDAKASEAGVVTYEHD